MGIPQTQRAAVVEQPGPDGKCVIKEIPVPVPNDDEILVKLSWSGLCHTDVHLIKGDWGNMGLNMTAKVSGHEGVGVVVSVGKNVKRFQVGDRAGIKWVADTCGNCEFCTNGVDELHCAQQLNSGATTEGTFQQYVTTSGRYATKIPAGVSDEEAGPVSSSIHLDIMFLFLLIERIDPLRWCHGIHCLEALGGQTRTMGRPSRCRWWSGPSRHPVREGHGNACHRHRRW